MTIGEKIQKYRKQLEMSQEELGQKLLVSRQTISLWEKDQTVPTIDNLIRLREIFGASVDEMLGFENIEQNNEILPNESYRFTFSKQELNEIYRLQRKNFYKRLVIFTVLCVLLIVFFISLSAPDVMIGFAFGVFFIGLVSHIKGIRAYSKVWKNSTEPICKSIYEYKVFDDYININIYRENEKIRESKCFLPDIEQIQQLDKWLLLQFGGQLFIIRKSELKENSAFYSYMYRNPSKVTEKITHNRWKVISIIFFVASLLSLFIAMGLVLVMVMVNTLFIENMWVFFLVTPIPVSSIILGFVLKAKKQKYLKNIFVGIIMTALLCIYGSFSFIFANVYDHSDKPIVRIEQTIGIDIPKHKQINTQDWTKGTQSVSRGYIYSTSDIYFDDSAVEDFEKQLTNDDKWLSSISSDMIGITSPMYDSGIYDYVLIYNVDTSEYNTLPSNSGNFRFINILYKVKDNTMLIVEYDIDYVK